MKGWIVAFILGVAGALAYEYQTERVRVLRDEVSALRAASEDVARRHAIEIERMRVDSELMEGGDEGLSDYMSGAAGKLWP